MRKFFDQLYENFNKLKKSQKIIVISVFSTVFLIMVFSFIYAGKTEWTVLFNGLNDKEAAKITRILDENQFKYMLENGTSTILVPVQNKSAITMKLAESDTLPNKSNGWAEIFESTSLVGNTRQREKIDKLRGLQGELENTISQIEVIERCRVHITMPETALFEEDKQEPTGAVILKPKPLEEIKLETVKAVMNLVAFAVEGLAPKNVKVMNTSGKILSDEVEFKDPLTKNSMTILEIKKEYEKELSKKAQIQLTKVLGAGNSDVKISLALDFDKIETKIQSFAPPIPGEDTGIKRSEETEVETYKGTGVFPGGVPGTDTNIPGYKGVDKERSDYKRDRMISNFEINKEDVHKIKTPGSIKRMTVSVIVDSERKLKPEEKQALTDNVKYAIGYLNTRGDTIQFTQIHFDDQELEEFNRQLEAEKRRQLIMTLVVVFIIILAVVGWLFTRWLNMKREERERLLAEQQEEEEIINIEEPFGPVLTVEEQERREMEERLKRYARNNAKNVAQLLRVWLIEEM